MVFTAVLTCDEASHAFAQNPSALWFTSGISSLGIIIMRYKK
jgi:hypothetical protein